MKGNRWVLGRETLSTIQESIGDFVYFDLDTAQTEFSLDVADCSLNVHYTMERKNDGSRVPVFLSVDCVNKEVVNVDDLLVAASTGFEDGYEALVEDTLNSLFFRGV